MSSPKPLIGIVDDERNIQATLVAILERRGYSALSAFTGRQGLQMITENHPDVVLLDLGLPDSEGLDLLKTIRQNNPTLPVIVVTANYRLGVLGFLSLEALRHESPRGTSGN